MHLDPVFNRLATVSEFTKLSQRFGDVQGFLTDLEGYALLQLAGHGPGIGAIVEIGSFQGRSTAFLAAGSKAAAREKVTAVDHFRGSPEHQAGQSHADATLVSEGTTFRAFQENLRRLGLDDYVEPVIAGSVEAAQRWSGAIRLLFIDGDHAYETSKQDFLAWSPFVVTHGLLCFHDVTQWPGVTKFYQELVASPGPYREVFRVHSLRVLQRVT